MPVDWNKPVEVKWEGKWISVHSVAVSKCDKTVAAITWYIPDGAVRCTLTSMFDTGFRNTPEPETEGWRYFVGASGVRYRVSPRTCQKLLDDGNWGNLEDTKTFWTETDADWKPLNETKAAQVEHPVFGDDWHVTVGDLKRAIAYLRRSTETNPHFKHVFEGIIFALKVLVTEDKPGQFAESAGR